VMLAASDGTSAKFYTANAAVINDGIWHHVGFTLDASPFALTLYVDGLAQTATLVTDLTFSGLRQDATVDVTIGSLLSGASPALPIEGDIHRPIICDKVLTQSEINELYGNGASFDEVSDLTFSANVVASYKFSAADSLSGVLDETTNNNDGTYNGELADFITAVPEEYYGISFNGSNEYITVPHSASLNLSSAMTVFFCYRYSNIANEQVFISKADYGANKRSWFVEKDASSPARIAVLLSDNGTNNRKYYFTAANNNNNGWNSFAFTWGASTLTLYKNGVDIMGTVTKSADTAMTNLHQPTDVNVLIGAIYNNGVPALPYNGRMDRVMIFNTALSAAQIEDLHEAVFNHTSLSALDSFASCVMSQSLNEHATFDDETANNNDGVGTNMDAADLLQGVD
jgi:hypothetical protein